MPIKIKKINLDALFARLDTDRKRRLKITKGKRKTIKDLIDKLKPYRTDWYSTGT